MYNELDPGFRPKSTRCFFQRSRKITVWPWMKPLQDEVFRLNRCEVRFSVQKTERGPLLSMKYWLVNRDPFFMVYEIIPR